MRRAKSRLKFHLPEELWLEILSRLPVKSLLRFRCVSRSWKMWVDNPYFTRLHLNRFNNRLDSPILCVEGVSEWQLECVLKNSETLQNLFRLQFLDTLLVSPYLLIFHPAPIHNGVSVRIWSIVSQTDGLCLVRWKHQPDLMLWNPSIRKTLALPPLPENPSHKPAESEIVDLGVVFDPWIGDYKVVRLIPLWKMGVVFAAVYTLGTNSWKIIDCDCERGRPSLEFNRAPSYVCFDGVIYGIAREVHTLKLKLVSFDLRSEAFASLKMPLPQTQCSMFFLTTLDDGCSLALVHVRELKGSVWTMERLGDDNDAGSWIQRYTFDTVPENEVPHYTFLCFKKNGEMLVQWRTKVMCYNFQTQKQKILKEDNTKSFHVGNTVTYIESLILHSQAD